MQKRSETSDKVQKAADQLLANGQRPTQQAVRNIIGTGSITTINHALNFWWANLSQRLNRQSEHPGLPEPVITAASKLWDQAMVYSHAALNSQREEIQAELELKRAGENAHVAEMQVSLFSVQQQNKNLLETNEKLLQQKIDLTSTINQLESSLIQKGAKYDEQIRLNKQQSILLTEGKLSHHFDDQSDQLFQAKIDLKVNETILCDLKLNLKSEQEQNKALQQRLFDQEKEHIKQIHKLELVIAQQDVEYTNLKEKLEKF